MKNLKPVPADKKKSLGKLPTDVRNKMGYAQKGKMMSKRDKLIEKQNPKSEYKKDKFGKTKLSYTEAKEGKMMKKDKLKTLSNIAKSSIVGSGALATAKEARERMKKVPKKSLGGLLSGLAEKVFGKKASASKMPNVPGKMAMENGKLPIARLYQKATEQQIAKKSMGGEMKQGYGAARTSGMGLQDEDLIPGKSMDYYKDLM